MWWTIALLACGGGDPVASEDLGPPPLDAATIAKIDPHRIRDHVTVLADDTLGGRPPGSVGSAMARDYILAEMMEIGLVPVGLEDTYLFPYANTPEHDIYMLDAAGAVVPHDSVEGINLAGMVPGSDPARADEYIVVMAHYDHLGVEEDGTVYNGAFDNVAAVAMNLEIARVFLEEDARPERSIIFLFTDDEESGLDGAREWIGAPTVPQEDIVFGVSTDPLGRRLVPDFGPIALMGTDRSPGLEQAWRAAAAHTDTPVYFIHRDVIPIFASDQDPFYEQETPALWFTNLGFSFYHTTGDTAETIDYRMILADAELLALALHGIGNSDERFRWAGPTEPKGATAREARRLLRDLKKSTYLDAGDQELADFYIAQLDLIIAADSHDAVDSSEVLYTAALYFLLFDLPYKFVGEIPPPWPAGW